jgi:hypothetical protein
MPMETMVEALRRFEAAGYTDEFRAQPDGLRSLRTGRTVAPERLVVDDVARFEGPSNPSDEATVFALHAEDDPALRGTYTVAFGPAMDTEDAEMVPRLREGRRSH